MFSIRPVLVFRLENVLHRYVDGNGSSYFTGTLEMRENATFG